MYINKDIETFKFWCQKVLPLVYDDSLSYYEVLCKLKEKLNEVIGTVNDLESNLYDIVLNILNDDKITEIISDILSNTIINVKYPPSGIEPATGDGKTDDTISILKCINYAKEINANVYFPFGNYMISGININGVSIFGSDRYKTILTLISGSNNTLISDDGGNCGVYNITLNANKANNLNIAACLALSAYNYLVSNVKLSNGLTGLDTNLTNGHLQITDMIIDNCNDNFIGGIGYVTAGIFNDSSTTNGITINSSNGIYSITSIGNCEVGIVNNGLNNIINAIVTHSATSYKGTENDNSQVNISNSIKLNNYKNYSIISENISQKASNIKAECDIIKINSTQPIQYNHAPSNLNNYFNKIPMSDTNGNNYNVLVEKENVKYWETPNYANVKNYGAIGNGITNDTNAVQEALDNNNIVFFPEGEYLLDTIQLNSNNEIYGDNAVIHFNSTFGVDQFLINTVGTTGNDYACGSITANSYSFTCDSGNFNVGDWIEVFSPTQRWIYQNPDNPDGPFSGDIVQIIKKVGNTYTIDSGFKVMISSGAMAHKINMIENVKIHDLTFVGSNTPAARDSCIMLRYCLNAHVYNINVFGFDYYSIAFSSVIRGFIHNNIISGVLYENSIGMIFYAIIILNNSEYISVSNNIATKVRHLCLTTSASNLIGTPAYIDIIGNIAYNMMGATDGTSYAYENHGFGTFINWIGNIADSCYSGFNIEGQYNLITGNVIRNCSTEAFGIGGAYQANNNIFDNNFCITLNSKRTFSVIAYNKFQCVNNVVKNNVFIYISNDTYEGVYVAGAGNGIISNLVILNNVFDDRANSANIGSALLLNIGREILIKDNVILSSSNTIAISSSLIEKIEIIGNYIKSKFSTNNAIRVFNALVAKNYITGGNYGVIINSGGTTKVIQNIFDNVINYINGTGEIKQNYPESINN